VFVLVIVLILILITLIGIEAQLRKGFKQKEEIIELLNDIKKY
jgi:hypothetical protein